MPLRLLSLLSCALLIALTGCATTAPVESPEQVRARHLGEAVAQVEALQAAGKKVEAVAVMARFVELYPDSGDGWLQISRMNFDAGEYGAAIVAAEKVLGLKGDHRVARSVQAVSGLRIAAEALSALRDDEEMTGSARADAVNLARVLRETLGESVLVRPRTQAAPRPAARPPQQPAARAPAAAPARAQPEVDGDPFSVLR